MICHMPNDARFYNLLPGLNQCLLIQRNKSPVSIRCSVCSILDGFGFSNIDTIQFYKDAHGLRWNIDTVFTCGKFTHDLSIIMT